MDRTEANESVSPQLPFNRKERYFTATVLPGIIGCHDFAHLDRFVQLCGLLPGNVGDLSWPAFQFFTEYGFAESATKAGKDLWPDSGGRQTPDIVLSGPDWLITVEAKLYLNPTSDQLDKQMKEQAVVIQQWLRHKPVAPELRRHVLLLPGPLADKVRGVPWHIVTWEDVLGAYQDVAPAYWCAVLQQALDSYPDLVSTSGASGANADDKLKGSVIFTEYVRRAASFDHVGRKGGLRKFKEDVADNLWKSKRYEVRTGPPPNLTNWFTVGEFIDEVRLGTLAVPTVPPFEGDEPSTRPVMRHAYFDGPKHLHDAIQFSRWVQYVGGASQVQSDHKTFPSDAGVFEDCTRVFYVMEPGLDLDAAIGNVLKGLNGEPIPVDEYPGFADKYTHG